MPKKATVTLDIVAQACQSLKSEGVAVTVRAVREKLGRGSFATIQPLIKRLLNQQAQATPPLDDKIKPIVSAAAEMARLAAKEAREGLENEIEKLTKNLSQADALIKNLEEEKSLCELRLAQTIRELDGLKIKLETLLSELEATKAHASLRAKENEELRGELLKLKVREEDFHAARKEANEALERAARLEGRIMQMEEGSRKNIKAPKPSPLPVNNNERAVRSPRRSRKWADGRKKNRRD
ncbi:MAG: DNA-binding protein [Deltaproteobacteria bacterium]|jgi:chromosome segregation ATPase|nr:DNA-binding protein [Deltaproteobacteria bacterium]